MSFIMLCGHKPFESIDLPGNHVDISQSSLVSNIMMGRYSFQHPVRLRVTDIDTKHFVCLGNNISLLLVFLSHNPYHIFTLILTRQAWEFISEGAMLFIMSCFTMNYKKRPSAAQLFQEKWCAPHNINNELPTTKLKKYTRKLSRVSDMTCRSIRESVHGMRLFCCFLGYALLFIVPLCLCHRSQVRASVRHL